MQPSWLGACFSGRRPFLERLRAQEEKDEVMQALEEYRKPRDALLILVSDFIRICAPRLEELEEASLPPRYTVPELLDHISVNVSVVINHLTREIKKMYIFFNTRREFPYRQWNTKPFHFRCQRRPLSCFRSNGDLLTCEDNLLLSRVKRTCYFRVLKYQIFARKARLVFYWCSYNNLLVFTSTGCPRCRPRQFTVLLHISSTALLS